MSRYSGPGDFSGGSTPRQKVKALKRQQAVTRNALTPAHKRRGWEGRISKALDRLEAGKPAIS